MEYKFQKYGKTQSTKNDLECLKKWKKGICTVLIGNFKGPPTY